MAFPPMPSHKTTTESVRLHQGLLGQDRHIETLYTLWEELQLSSVEAVQAPNMDFLSFVDNTAYFGLIFNNRKPVVVDVPRTKAETEAAPIRIWEDRHDSVNLSSKKTETPSIRVELGCTTCWLRGAGKDCDQRTNYCGTCEELNLKCLGWGLLPDWIQDPNALAIYKNNIAKRMADMGLKPNGDPLPGPDAEKQREEAKLLRATQKAIRARLSVGDVVEPAIVDNIVSFIFSKPSEVDDSTQTDPTADAQRIARDLSHIPADSHLARNLQDLFGYDNALFAPSEFGDSTKAEYASSTADSASNDISPGSILPYDAAYGNVNADTSASNKEFDMADLLDEDGVQAADLWPKAPSSYRKRNPASPKSAFSPATFESSPNVDMPEPDRAADMSDLFGVHNNAQAIEREYSKNAWPGADAHAAERAELLNMWPNYSYLETKPTWSHNKKPERQSTQTEWTAAPAPAAPIGFIYIQCPPHPPNVPLTQPKDGYIGVILHAAARGQGFAREAVELTLDWALEDARLRRISARILEGPYQDTAAMMYTKLGFIFEGTRRRSVFHPFSSEYKDVTEYSLLDTDWGVVRKYNRPAPPEVWQDLFDRQAKERIDLMRWDGKAIRRTASMMTVTQVNLNEAADDDEAGYATDTTTNDAASVASRSRSSTHHSTNQSRSSSVSSSSAAGWSSGNASPPPDSLDGRSSTSSTSGRSWDMLEDGSMDEDTYSALGYDEDEDDLDSDLEYV